MTFYPNTDLIERLKKRADIRRQIPNRKSVQNNEPDRIADLLEEAAIELEKFLPVIGADGYPKTKCASCGGTQLYILIAPLTLRVKEKKGWFYTRIETEKIPSIPEIYCTECGYTDVPARGN